MLARSEGAFDPNTTARRVGQVSSGLSYVPALNIVGTLGSIGAGIVEKGQLDDRLKGFGADPISGWQTLGAAFSPYDLRDMAVGNYADRLGIQFGGELPPFAPSGTMPQFGGMQWGMTQPAQPDQGGGGFTSTARVSPSEVTSNTPQHEMPIMSPSDWMAVNRRNKQGINFGGSQESQGGGGASGMGRGNERNERSSERGGMGGV
jgi:hypothetical protein